MSTSIKQQVFDSVLEDLINGVYPIDFVFNEKYLIEKYQVSRSPIRDALIELCNEKVLRAIPRYGYEIVRITEQNMREIAQFRSILEVEIFKHTCERYCDEMLARIEYHNENTRRMLQSTEHNLRTMWEDNINFHMMLISFGNNQYAEDALKRALSMQYRAYSQLYWKKSSMSLYTNDFVGRINLQHNRLADCMRARDFDAAVQVLREDINDIAVHIQDE